MIRLRAFAAALLAAMLLLAGPWAHCAQTQAQAQLRFLPPTPTSATLCGEKVPLDDPDIAEAFDREFTIDVNEQAQVVMWLKRAGRFFGHISARLKERGMPDDLKYLAVTESALMRGVRSPAGAVGVWQFMPFTARRYGLRVDRWVDERRNFYKSTEAALDYLADLRREFGSWTLAMAAYNCGENGLRKNIALQGGGGYFDLHLPRETMRYIFRIISAKAIISDPAKYGYALPDSSIYAPRPVAGVPLKLAGTTDLYDIAQAAGITVRKLKDYNPEFIRFALPRGGYVVMVPPEGAPGLREAARRGLPPSSRYSAVTGSVYVVKRGDTLSGIAKKAGVSVADLKRENKVRGNKIYVGQRLRIPRDGG